MSVYVHLAGREPVRLSFGAAAAMSPEPADRWVSNKVLSEIEALGLFDGTQWTALGRQVAAVLAAEVPHGA